MAKVKFCIHSDAEQYQDNSLYSAIRNAADRVEYFQHTRLCGPQIRDEAYAQMWEALHQLSRAVAFAGRSLDE